MKTKPILTGRLFLRISETTLTDSFPSMNGNETVLLFTKRKTRMLPRPTPAYLSMQPVILQRIASDCQQLQCRGFASAVLLYFVGQELVKLLGPKKALDLIARAEQRANQVQK